MLDRLLLWVKGRVSRSGCTDQFKTQVSEGVRTDIIMAGDGLHWWQGGQGTLYISNQ